MHLAHVKDIVIDRMKHIKKLKYQNSLVRPQQKYIMDKKSLTQPFKFKKKVLYIL